jgi:hypothetical protein
MVPPAEFVAARWLRYLHRIPALPERFDEDPPSRHPTRPVSLVVVGESTAEGHPYHPRLSIGQIVGWHLDSLRPGRTVEVDVRATGGICLEQAILFLGDLKRKPDALLICSGHNEFQARFGWSRNVRHYTTEGDLPGRSAIGAALGRISSVSAMIERSIDLNGLDRPPPPRVTRRLVDRPAFTRDEYAFLLDDYARRLDALLAYCRRIGTVPIVVVPPSNLADYPPNRSYLEPEASEAERSAFDRAFRAAREREAADPGGAEQAYRRLIDRHPTFAETHFRLGQQLLRTGRFSEARRHLARARDLDGMPMRCPGDFEGVCRTVARRHGALLVDGPDVLARLSPDGVPGDDLFHDAHHPTLAGYVALAQEVVDQLATRRLLGLTTASAVPRIDPAACAERFAIDRDWWATVCDRSASFWLRTAYMRYDPSTHLEMAHRYARAAEQVRDGVSLEQVGIGALRFKPAQGAD